MKQIKKSASTTVQVQNDILLKIRMGIGKRISNPDSISAIMSVIEEIVKESPQLCDCGHPELHKFYKKGICYPD